MNVKRGSFILFNVSNDLFDRPTDFSLTFQEVCLIEGNQSTGTPKLNYLKGITLVYATNPEPVLILSRGGKILKKYYRQTGTQAEFVRILFHGVVFSFTPRPTYPIDYISIDQAELIELDSRYIYINNLNNCELLYEGLSPIDNYININSAEKNTIELTIIKDVGYTLSGADIELKVSSRLIGYDGGEIDIPFTFDKSHKTISIPACVLFADTEDGVTPNYISVSLRASWNKNYEVKLSNKNVLITDGFTVNEVMNETLDSGTIKFVSKMSSIDIEQYDPVFIENEEMNITRKKQLVDTFSTSVVEYNDTNIFESDIEYTVSLFSETKTLERIPLPNLVITKRAENPLTVYQKVLEYCQTYLPRIAVFYEGEQSVNVLKKCSLRLDPTLSEKLNMECPELHWNNPTLREVLTDLFAVGNLIPVVKDNVLSYFDLHRKGNEIDQTKITDFSYEGVSSDYCDELFIPISNVIQNGKTKISEYSSVKSEGERFGDSNTVFATTKPINRIISVKVFAKIKDTYQGNNDMYLKEIDITDKVIEKSEFDAKNPKDRFTSHYDYIDDFSLFNLYFVRGERNIRHIIDSTYFSWAAGSEGNYSKINLVVAAKICQASGSEEVYHVRPNLYNIPDSSEVFCLIEYEAIDETTLSIGREKQIKNKNNKLFDGQSSSIVDLGRQVEQEYSKVNRFGNKVLNIYGSYTDENLIPQLSDRIGNMILFSRELQYFNDVILFHGRLCENYVLKNYFTSIQNEKRIFQLVQNEDATTRHDNIKVYIDACLDKDKCKWTWYPNENGNFRVNVNKNVIAVSLDPVRHSHQGHWLNTEFTLNNCLFYNTSISAKYGSGSEFELDANYDIVGKSYIVDFGFYDNINAGNGVAVDDGGGKYAVPYVYTDENGEFKAFHIDIVNKYDAGDGDFVMSDYIASLKAVVDPSDFENDKFNAVVQKARTRPKVNSDGIDGNRNVLEIDYLNYYKDNSERLKMTVQFEIGSRSKEVFIKNSFLQTLRYYTDEVRPISIYIAENEQYEENDTLAKGTLREDLSLSFSDPDNTAHNDYLELTGDFELNNNDCWCVADENGNIILAVNGSETKVNFQIRTMNDINVYNNVIDKVRIGNLTNTALELKNGSIENPAYVDTITVMGRSFSVLETKDIDEEVGVYIG